MTNEEYLTQQLGEYIGAMTRLSILALTNDKDMLRDLFFETTKLLTPFREQPEPVKAAAREFRLKTWNIE